MTCVRLWWGSLAFLLLSSVLDLRQCVLVEASSDGNETSLHQSTCNQRDCLRCDLESAECVKCLYVIDASTRVCLATCPPGYSITWPSDANLLGRVCTERSMLALVSGRDVTIIAGAAVGGAICVGVVIGTLLYMKRRAKPPPYYPPPEPRQRYPIPRLWKDKRPSASEKPVPDEERAEFLEQLACLRGEATNFLEMLSHTQTRFRSLGNPDSPTDTKTKAYRAVVRDLSRVLTLLNRREEHILTVPGDWRRLLSWAARVLARYKRQKTLKENGDIPALDPVYAGGTLYQTRRQTQAQRCRLVTQSAPPLPPLQADTPQESLDSSSSHMGSRSNSMMSLTPIILEEAEGEVQFEEDLGIESPNDLLSNPGTEDIEKQDNQESFRKPNHLTQNAAVNGICNQGSSMYNHKLPGTDLNHYNLNNNHNYSYNPSITTNHKLPGTDLNHYNFDNNHNTYNHSVTTNHCHKPYGSMQEEIMNLRNLEQRLDERNIDKYLTPEGSPIHDHLIPSRTKIQRETACPRECLGPAVFERSAVNAVLPGADVYTNVIRKPVLSPVFWAEMETDPYRDDTTDRSEMRGGGGGETEVERRVGGGEREDRGKGEGIGKVRESENVRGEGGEARSERGGPREVDQAAGRRVERGRGRGHRRSPRSCKMEAKRQMSVPRCDLTTDL